MKNLFINIGLSYESKKDFLFELLCFPKNNFSKEQISKLLAVIKTEMSKEKLDDIMDSFTKTFYYYEDYRNLIRENLFLIDLVNMLGKINFLPYIFFNLPAPNLKIQRDCISILMNNEKNLKSYILSSLESHNEYYCVDISFWKDWCALSDWDFDSMITNTSTSGNMNNNIFFANQNINENKISEIKTNSTSNNTNSTNMNYDPINKLEIHIDFIVGIKSDVLRPGVEYFVDYILLPKIIYNLFKLWYKKCGDDIQVNKICYDIDGFKTSFQLESENEILNNVNFKKTWPVMKYESSKRSISLIEIYPVQARYFKYDEITSSIKTQINIDSIKEILDRVLNNPNSNMRRTVAFSRKTRFGAIKNYLYTLNNLPTGSKPNSRIWIYNNGDLEIIHNENLVLETMNITEKFIIIIEIKANNIWPSALLFENEEKNLLINMNDENNNYSSEMNYMNNNLYGDNTGNYGNAKAKTSRFFYGKGIANIGNTCYLNSVLQIFMNLEPLKNFLSGENFNYWVNKKNKYGYNGRIINAFYSLFMEYHQRNTKENIIRPNKFKAFIGDINPQFKNFDQQDSQEFLSYLIDVLHEELNLKNEKEYIPNPERFIGSEAELSGEYWSNNLRRNTSLIHSLFLGQMKSILKCEQCLNNKVSYETFTNLNIPIPQKKTILLNIYIYRIPFTYKAYYFDLIENKHKLQHTQQKFTQETDGNKKLISEINLNIVNSNLSLYETSPQAIENNGKEDKRNQKSYITYNNTSNAGNYNKNEYKTKANEKIFEDINRSCDVTPIDTKFENLKHIENNSKLALIKENIIYNEPNNLKSINFGSSEDCRGNICNISDINLYNFSTFTVRDRLNMLRKESYEKIKLMSNNNIVNEEKIKAKDEKAESNSDFNVSSLNTEASSRVSEIDTKSEGNRVSISYDFNNKENNNLDVRKLPAYYKNRECEKNISEEQKDNLQKSIMFDNHDAVSSIYKNDKLTDDLFKENANKEFYDLASKSVLSIGNLSNSAPNKAKNFENKENANFNNDVNNRASVGFNEEKSYTSRLVTSIPIKITMEFDRKAKVQSIIDTIKSMKEFELEQDSKFTNLILIGQGLEFFTTDLKIDECLQNDQTIHIYEFLNSRGLEEIIWGNKKQCLNNEGADKNFNNSCSTFYSSIKNFDENNYKNYNNDLLNENNIDNGDKYFKNIEKISYEGLKLFKMPILDFWVQENKKHFEYLVEINHRFASEKGCYIFNQTRYSVNHNFFFDALLLNNTVI